MPQEATKIFNNREEEEKTQKFEEDYTKSLMLAEVIQKGFQKSPYKTPCTDINKGQRSPPEPCYKCGHCGHWERACLHPRQLPGPCPLDAQMGHWKLDCP
jgi:hypothetical protein